MKWLDLLIFQLKQDLFNALELENDQERIVKGDLFIKDMKSLGIFRFQELCIYK